MSLGAGQSLARRATGAVDPRLLSVVIVVLFGLGPWTRTEGPLTLPAPILIHPDLATDTGVDERPQIATDGLGNWVAIWDSFGAFGAASTQLDILFSRSADNGATWTAPARLSINDNMAARQDWRPTVTTDAHGHWVAVWYTNHLPGSSTPGDFFIVVSRSTDNGATWTAPAVLNASLASAPGNEQIPRLATDSQGHWVCAWESSDNILGKGVDFDILVARSNDNGATWTPPTLLNSYGASDTGEDSRVEIVTDSAGTWVAAWSTNSNIGSVSGSDNDIAWARSTDNGATWSAATLLDSGAFMDTRMDFRPALATNGAGLWIAAWHGGNSGSESDLFVVRSLDNAMSWSAASMLNSTGTGDFGEDVNVRITTDRLGNWIAAWESNSTVVPGTGPDFEAMYSLSIDDGQHWSNAAVLNTDAASESGFDLVPQLGTDGLGNWLAMWESTATPTSDFEISYARFVLNPPQPVWVDFGYSGDESGTSSQPFRTMGAALADALPGGTISIKGDMGVPYTLEALTIDKPLRIEAVGGPIRIGGEF